MAQTHPSQGKNNDMLEEDSLDTLKNQGKTILIKIKYVLLMLPGDREEAVKSLKEWDLWGPFLICLLFSICIGIEADSKYYFDSFVNVFAIFWVGSFLAGINCRLLGNKASIFQSISVIGYCMLPISLMGLMVALMPRGTPSFVKLILILLALCWSTVSCMLVMRDLISETKKFLCGYPICLFYIYLSWYAIVS